MHFNRLNHAVKVCALIVKCKLHTRYSRPHKKQQWPADLAALPIRKTIRAKQWLAEHLRENLQNAPCEKHAKRRIPHHIASEAQRLDPAQSLPGSPIPISSSREHPCPFGVRDCSLWSTEVSVSPFYLLFLIVFRFTQKGKYCLQICYYVF